MRAVIQRVKRAEIRVNETIVSQIGPGILTLLGICKGDREDPQLKRLIQKIVELRIFEDDQGKMNKSLIDIQGSHLIVSQFTLAADTSSGRRPSFVQAEVPELAQPLYEKAIQISTHLGIATRGGIFQADMKVELINDGPVTFVLDQ